jgi:serine-aspartate repeat-containing protein C/D/E
MWVVDWNGDGKFDNADKTYSYGGLAGDMPIVGDWSGDGRTKLGIVRDGSTWLLDLNGNFQFDSGDLNFVFGAKGDIPVVGRWPR